MPRDLVGLAGRRPVRAVACSRRWRRSTKSRGVPLSIPPTAHVGERASADRRAARLDMDGSHVFAGLHAGPGARPTSADPCHEESMAHVRWINVRLAQPARRSSSRRVTYIRSGRHSGAADAPAARVGNIARPIVDSDRSKLPGVAADVEKIERGWAATLCVDTPLRIGSRPPSDWPGTRNPPKHCVARSSGNADHRRDRLSTTQQ